MRLVIRTTDARRARALQGALERADLDAVALIGAAAGKPAPQGEDVTLLDAAAPGAATMARALRRDIGAALAIVAAGRAPPERPSPFDAWLALDAPATLMRRALQSIHRDGLCYEEVRARRRTAAALGLPAPPEATPPGPLAALFVGAPSPAFLAIERAWGDQGGDVAGAFSSFAAFDSVHDERFDTLILNALDDPPAALSLCGAVRRNARLHHIPVLTLVRPDDSETREAALTRGASLIAGEGDDLSASMAWLAADVDRARRRRYALIALAATPEASTPWTVSTFAAHLQTLADAHHMRGRPLCLGILRARRPRADAQAWARGFQDLTDLAARLVRASDSTARIDDATIMFAFPSTQEEGARAALKRVLAVWDCTAFAAGGEDEGALAFTSATLELLPGESGSGLFARAGDLLEGRARRG